MLPLRQTITFTIMAIGALSFAPATLSSDPLRPIGSGFSGPAKELTPKAMEKALLVEQDRQDAIASLDAKLSGSFAIFEEAYAEMIDTRHRAAAAEAESLMMVGGCNLGSVEGLKFAPDSFVKSTQLRQGRDQLADLRADLKGKRAAAAFQAPSDAPPVITYDVLALISQAAGEIRAINARYSHLCLDAEQRMAKLPIAESEAIMTISKDLNASEIELAQQVVAQVEALNHRIDLMDQTVIAWLLAPMETAATAQGSGPHSEKKGF